MEIAIENHEKAAPIIQSYRPQKGLIAGTFTALPSLLFGLPAHQVDWAHLRNFYE